MEDLGSLKCIKNKVKVEKVVCPFNQHCKFLARHLFKFKFSNAFNLKY